MKTISVFTGAGGLDLGLEAAGFEPALCIEIDPDARATLAANRPRWKLSEPGDLLAASPEAFLKQAGLTRGEAALIVAGPECQPFSHAARWASNGARGLTDPRAHALEPLLKLMEVSLPRGVLLENVYGLVRPDHLGAIGYLKHRINQINQRNGTHYMISEFRLNCADYGVPQVRRRAFIAIDREGGVLEPPEPTHTREEYVTAWDAIGDVEASESLEELEPTGKWAALLATIPEGKNYLWHTARGGGVELFGWRTRYWSFLLKLAKHKPSWTITANPGPAMGPFHWDSRRLSTAETLRLQAFPDRYEIVGSFRSQRRQIGNATPPLLSEVVARHIAYHWFSRKITGRPAYFVKSKGTCPPPANRYPIPRKYLGLVGSYDPHPGATLGPGAVRSDANSTPATKSEAARTTL
ncbi:MAG: DNA cytosine methyltransferase [Chloroflexi bacterium]|nr:DNA cytosine methyltransferase [Chloroflexota bacterium]